MRSETSAPTILRPERLAQQRQYALRSITIFQSLVESLRESGRESTASQQGRLLRKQIELLLFLCIPNLTSNLVIPIDTTAPLI